MGKMTFEGKPKMIEAVQVTASNATDIARNYGLTVKDGQLYDTKGILINAGIWVCRFEDGYVKFFSDDIFNRLFAKVEPPTYKISDVPDLNRNIRRKGWDGIYLRNDGYCFVMCETEHGAIHPYTFTADDLTASDWEYTED